MEVFKKREAVFDDAVGQIQAKIEVLQARQRETGTQLVEAEETFDAAKEEVDPSVLNRYLRMTEGTKMPVVVALEQHTCKGCHLRVSNETVEQSRRGEGLTTCDNCGRIVYSAS